MLVVDVAADIVDALVTFVVDVVVNVAGCCCAYCLCDILFVNLVACFIAFCLCVCALFVSARVLFCFFHVRLFVVHDCSLLFFACLLVCLFGRSCCFSYFACLLVCFRCFV